MNYQIQKIDRHALSRKSVDAINPIQINQFRPESSDHRPKTELKLAFTDDGFHGLFTVNDRYVRCVNKGFQSAVWQDACVEFFVKPKNDKGYFNFEFNCGGSFLSSYVEDATRLPDGGLGKSTPLSGEEGKQIKVSSSMPEIVDPEISEPIEWALQFFIPFSVLEKFIGKLSIESGAEWKANFYKCAENNSHPHWASWAAVDELNFHLPRCFGTIVFE